MPIDASSDSFEGGLGPDPAATKVNPDDIVVAPKADVDLDDAGTGAKSTVGLDLSLDDAGQGAKVDPSLRADDDDTTFSKGGGLGSVFDHHAGAEDVKDLAIKDFDIGASPDDHTKGLVAHDDDHDHGHDDHGHGHDDHHDHGHDVDHGHDDHGH